MEFESKFDLIIASDVVYLPECIEPLIKSIKYFLKPESGICVYVNNRIRIDALMAPVESSFAKHELGVAVREEIVKDSSAQNRKFIVN